MLRVALVAAALLMNVSGTLSEGQMSPPFPAQPQLPPGRRGADVPPLGPGEPLPPQVEEQQNRSRNTDRQKRL
ncbi:MAG: hypothetical protein ABI380_02705, partial [Edaphobacter sp.]